jgi:hypothetical protein
MSVFALKSTDISTISQPSDLFGKEILPECTFESEYGKLKFNAVIVPDFSKDKIELELLTKHFDDIKAFMKEDDLLKKSKIASRLFMEAGGFILTTDGYEFVNKNSFFATVQERQMDFRNLLRVGILFRLFETGISMRYSICLEFGFDSFHSTMKEDFLNSLMSYNGNAVIQPLACATGIYILCLGKYLIPESVCNHDFPDTLVKIKELGVPRNNFLSWALFNASSDYSLLNLVSKSEFHSLIFWDS